MFTIDTTDKTCIHLEKHLFNNEEDLQQILYNSPEILLSNNELNIPPYEKIVKKKEYPTARGSIDIVFITENGDIILVETKLLKNPESKRKVVAQAIDYAKSFSEENFDSLKSKLSDMSIFSNQYDIEPIIETNIKSGNYTVLIVGDIINPHILGMVESIQSAPHLSFTIFALSLNSYAYAKNNLILYPKVESKTIEIERSVISIEVKGNEDYKISSSTPNKGNKGNKPKITEEKFYENLEKDEFIDNIKYLCKEIRNMGGTIDWGTVGFSGGYRLNGRRISLIWVYDSFLNILSNRVFSTYDHISTEQYNEYLSELKRSDYVYENIIVANRSAVEFSRIDKNDLNIIIEATLQLMKNTMKNDE